MIKNESRDVVKQASKKPQRGKHSPGLVGEDSKPVSELLVTETSAEKMCGEKMLALDLFWMWAWAGKPHVMVGSVVGQNSLHSIDEKRKERFGQCLSHPEMTTRPHILRFPLSPNIAKQ